MFARRLTRILTHEIQVSDRDFLEISMQYLLLTLEHQVYYHLGDHLQYDLLPNFITRLGHCILDPKCDHLILLQYHPVLVQAYFRCLESLSVSNGVEIKFFQTTSRLRQLRLTFSYAVSLFWEPNFDRDLSLARHFFSKYA